jgi:hypothetical protein
VGSGVSEVEFCSGSWFVKIRGVAHVFLFLIAAFAMEVLGFMPRCHVTRIVEIFHIFHLFFTYRLVCIVHRCLEILIT